MVNGDLKGVEIVLEEIRAEVIIERIGRVGIMQEGEKGMAMVTLENSEHKR